MKRLAVLLLVVVMLGPLVGCQGQGTGQVTGTLFLRGCSAQGTLAPTGMPNPLPAFTLDPHDFFATPTTMLPPDYPEDVRGANTLIIRIQRDGSSYERTDGFIFYINDSDALIASHPLGQPLTFLTADLSGGSVPLPSGPMVGVMAGLYLNGTCPYAFTVPYLSGSITFSQLGNQIGDPITATFSATVLDPRADRAATPAGDRDAAGALSGSFSINISSAVPAATY